jgi:DNA-binding LacI/PurR family transcriptional regulator
VSTIQDVARRAGVSASTVSNVLNGRADRMGKETLARVQAAIEALAFRPSRAARQLKTGHTPMIGLLVPSIANPMYGYMAREVETAAFELHGLRVVLGNTYRNARKETDFFDDLLDHGVRGVVIVSSLADEAHFEAAVDRGLAVVSYDRRAMAHIESRIDHISMDNVEAGRLATAHLIEHGHTRLALATASGETMSRRDKITGFLAAAEGAGLRDSAQVIHTKTLTEYGDSEMADVGRELAARLAADRHRPTGVVAVNDMLAIGLIAGLHDAGLSVPADVSVIGMDDLILSTLVTPRLTSVHTPVPTMARTIVQRLVARMAQPQMASAEFLFAPTLTVRQSVAQRRRRRGVAAG